MTGRYKVHGPNDLDEPSVILSSGPARVDTSDPDPAFRARKVGFVQPMTTEEHADLVTFCEVAGPMLSRMVEALTPIADQDPWTTDAGDQS
jgi:hypothetical protein